MKVLVTDKVHKEGLEFLRKKGIEVVEKEVGSEKELIDIISDFYILIVRSRTKVTRSVIEEGKNLKIIGRAGVGLDNIDLEAANEKGIKVFNSPEASSVSVAELTVLFILAALRDLCSAHNSTKEGKWEKKKFMGLELMGKKVGIIGLGRIGKEVAKRLKCFETQIYGFDPFVTDFEYGIKVEVLEDIFRNCDIVTLHIPLNNETKHIVNERVLKESKKGIILVNCARGGVIDENALLKALNEGIVSKACLDVFEEEPPSNKELLAHPNVILSPHIGAQTEEAQKRASLILAEKIIDYLGI
jgi:D-3-phosphoglycerate dehydrogenase